MKSGLPALLLAVCLPAAAAAPEPTHLLATLAGDWDLAGTVLGKPAHYRAQGRWVLHGGWLEFSMVDLATPPDYEARVFIGYDAKAGDYVAHWLDRFGAAGARVTATGSGQDGTLVLLFPYAEGAFRDTLSLAPDGARVPTTVTSASVAARPPTVMSLRNLDNGSSSGGRMGRDFGCAEPPLIGV